MALFLGQRHNEGKGALLEASPKPDRTSLCGQVFALLGPISALARSNWSGYRLSGTADVPKA